MFARCWPCAPLAAFSLDRSAAPAATTEDSRPELRRVGSSYTATDYKAPDYSATDYKAQNYSAPSYKATEYKATEYKATEYKAPDYKVVPLALW